MLGAPGKDYYASVSVSFGKRIIFSVLSSSVKVKEALFVYRFIMSCSSLRRSGMTTARVLPATHAHVYLQVK